MKDEEPAGYWEWMNVPGDHNEEYTFMFQRFKMQKPSWFPYSTWNGWLCKRLPEGGHMVLTNGYVKRSIPKRIFHFVLLKILLFLGK